MYLRTFTLIFLLATLGTSACSNGNSNTEAAQMENSANPDASTLASVSPSPQPQTSRPPGTLVSADGKSEIVLPEGWKEAGELYKGAQIQAFKPNAQMYVIVLSESKEQFPTEANVTLERHSEITRTILTGNLANPTVSGPTAVKDINANPAVQYIVRGKLKNSDLEATYIHTTVETASNFNQILAWTTPTEFDKNKAELERVVSSFREVSQPPTRRFYTRPR
jgi:hypothetical protein